MDRRTFIGTAAAAVVAAPRLGQARPSVTRRVPRVGVLGETNPVSWMVTTPVVDIECRWADVARAGLPDLAGQLVARDVDVIVAVGAEPARAAARRTSRIPIVVVADEADGVAVPSRPNVTWLSAPSETGMVRQRVRLLHDLVPQRERVAVLFNPDSAANARAVTRLSGATADVLPLPSRSMEDVERALAAVGREARRGLVVLADTLFAVHAGRLVALLTEAGVPAVYGARTFVDAGGLIALYGDTGDTVRRTAALVRALLAGVPAAAARPEPPPRPQVALNLAAAARLGLEIPPALRAQAAR